MKPQKGGGQELLLQEQMQQKAFEEIKQALTNTPSLGLPDMSKPICTSTSILA